MTPSTHASGGDRTEVTIGILLDCAELAQTSANFISGISSRDHVRRLCRALPGV
jgi:hypothetical protein